MNTLFEPIPDFKKARGNPLYLSIAGHIEELVKSGKLSHGQRLPTTADFAKMFNVTVTTAQQSLSTLMEKGLLSRSTRKGTFINVSPMSRNIAIVFGSNPLEYPSFYYRQLLKYFGELGDEAGLNISCHFALGGSSFESKTKMLREDARNGRYAYIIPIFGNPELMRWLLSQKDVPWIWQPDVDVQSMVHDGLSYLLEKGFRKITFVSQCLSVKNELGNTAGMEYQGAWNAFAVKGLPIPGDMFKYWGGTTEDGYREIKKIMSDKNSRPEALFINHDLLTKGALKGLDEMGLKIPHDIALITHANKGDVFESSIPLTRLEIDPYEVARSMINYAKSRILNMHGNIEAKLLKDPDIIKAKLIIGKSCGEK
ncbi:MAG: substrate-binding domain-containing protein [Victivallales bacterium]|jgi:hypothetical protein